MRRLIAAVLATGWMAISPAGVPLPAVAAAGRQTGHDHRGQRQPRADQRRRARQEDRRRHQGPEGERLPDPRGQEAAEDHHLRLPERRPGASRWPRPDRLRRTSTTKKKTIADLVNNQFAAAPDELKDRRLIVMFFDLSSMQPEDITRAVDAAKDYINKHMAPADLAASVSLVSGLSMDQDFTSDKAALLAAVSKYDGTDRLGLRLGQRRRRHRRHLRRLHQLRRRRQRVQRAQHRPPALRHPHRLQVHGEGRAEEEHALLLRRPHAGRALRTRPASAPPPTSASRRTPHSTPSTPAACRR